ncbi:hypothetical protein EZV73_06340 [Acidaminobacter sp. JC074]|uniref:sensor histidine kinase n=1 Tax=Acidaminobacter sp. JC074 TaxID=2530199 RepID=UPI001F0F8027|nr:histidine kinase [Acidaminobacter sp. JC074]MCH4887180.1 hypothetical protein [Acidaminobacter sp. JC074]
MSYLISIWFFIIEIILHYNTDKMISPEQVFILVSGLCLVVLTIRLKDIKYINVLMIMVSFIGVYFYPSLVLIVSSLVSVNYQKRLQILVVMMAILLSLYLKAFFLVGLIPIVFGIRYYKNVYEETKVQLTNKLDSERKLRYDLEDAKKELMDSQEEIVMLTEVHERNRIARDIHDKVGHQLMGTLMALETSIVMEDREIKDQFLNKAYDQLKDGIDMVRETVHDMSTYDKVGFSSFIEVVDNFSFCQIKYDYKGDVNSIPTHVYVVLIMNLKEALTNVMKYSKASEVKVSLEVNDVYIRLTVADDGKEIVEVSEGLGLSGMRHRLQGVGGILSYHYDNGFNLVMYIKRG